jgi:hypothetical protein
VQDSVAVTKLQQILRPQRRRRGGHHTAETYTAQHRRVTRTGGSSSRQGGLAVQCAAVLEEMLRRVNKVHCLTLYPLTLADTLKHLPEGRELQRQHKQAKTPIVWKQACAAIVNEAGRGLKESVTGVLGRSLSEGHVPMQEISAVTGQTQRFCRKAIATAKNGHLGAFAALSKSGSRAMQALCPSRAQLGGVCVAGTACELLHECQCCRVGPRQNHAASACPAWSLTKCNKINAARKTTALKVTKDNTPTTERIATQTWFGTENPARSGDQQAICWMVKGFTDFYHEDYRSAAAQVTIIEGALLIYGDELRAAAATRANVWLRNVDKYLAAERTATIQDLRVQDIRPFHQTSVEAIQRALDAPNETYGHLDPLPAPDGEVNEEKHDDADADDEVDTAQADDDPNDPYVLTPRSSVFFYKRLLGGMRLWKRPPHNHCTRCAEFVTTRDTLCNLTVALCMPAEHPEYQRSLDLIERAGGRQKAWVTQRQMTLKLPDLQKHMDWQADQRPYSMRRERKLTWLQAMLYLDYGGFTDSANEKVAVWSATVMAKDRPQEHFDFFFNQGGKGKDTDATAKKNGQTGITFLGELFDKDKSPHNDGVSMFHRSYPGKDEVVLSGDTGNGYRAYAMLEELSTFYIKYGLKVTLLPLPPGHAWNRTDARIAHQNTFLESLKAIGRVRGAEEIAEAFHEAADPKYQGTRKYMERSHCFFRVVQHDAPQEAKIKKKLGAMLVSEAVDKGQMGVRGMLYFDFSVVGPAGDIIRPQGYARVREFANPDRPNNPTHVYTWRKDLAANMCQQCSDAHGGPVALHTNGCTKKTCGVAAAKTAANQAAAAARVLPPLPLNRRPRVGAKAGKAPAGPVNAAVDPAKAGEEPDEAPGMPPAMPAQAAGGGARKRGRPPSRGNKAPAPKRTQPPVAEEEKRSSVRRQVRVVHGRDPAKARAQVWMYVPCEDKAKSGKSRRGFWLDATDQEHGLFALRADAAIQQGGGPTIKDVAIFEDFPFTRLVKLDKRTKKEVQNTIRFITARPFAPGEVEAAKNGYDVAGPLDEIAPVDPANDSDGLDDSDGGDGEDEDDDDEDDDDDDDDDADEADEAGGGDDDDDADNDDSDTDAGGSDGDDGAYPGGLAPNHGAVVATGARRSTRARTRAA